MTPTSIEIGLSERFSRISIPDDHSHDPLFRGIRQTTSLPDDLVSIIREYAQNTIISEPAQIRDPECDNCKRKVAGGIAGVVLSISIVMCCLNCAKQQRDSNS